jgi:sugar lactone lactonase YvrE
VIKYRWAVLTALLPLFSITACSGVGSTASSTSAPLNAGAQSAAMQPLASLTQTLEAAKGPKVSGIYVAQFQAFNIELFGPTGNLIGLTSGEIDGPQNIVFDKTGTLFVADFGNDTIISYTKALSQNAPIVYLPASPVGLAVGPAGKLFATLYPSGEVVAYDQNGQQTTPTIAGPGNVTYVAVDAKGKIYVTDSSGNRLTTYNADGTPTTPTITAGLNGPGDVVVDGAGKIYVANGAGNGSITTYNPDGTRAKPTIAVNGPHGLAVAKNGDIYVTDSTNNSVEVFKPNGKPASPTISGLNTPTGIAVI